MRNLASNISSGKYIFVIFLIPFLIVILSLIHKLFYSSSGNPEVDICTSTIYRKETVQLCIEFRTFYFLSISILFLRHYLISSYHFKVSH